MLYAYRLKFDETPPLLDNLKMSNVAPQTAEPLVFSTPPLIFTTAAAQKVQALIQEEGNLQLNLRVSITGGGCSGFQYGFSFDEVIDPDDTVIEKHLEDKAGKLLSCIRLLVDPISLQYLQGAEIDYRDDVTGAQFIIRNPNAKTTCGCGSSFNTD